MAGTAFPDKGQLADELLGSEAKASFFERARIAKKFAPCDIGHRYPPPHEPI
jgi:hypothetical protein